MKSYTLMAALAAAMLLGSCAKEPTTPEQTGKAQIRFTLDGSARNAVTRTEGTNDNPGKEAALDKEKKVESILVAFYNSGNALLDIQQPTDSGTGTYTLNPPAAGTYNLLFVANADDNLKTAIQQLAGQTPATSPDDLYKLIAEQEPGTADKFLMTSDKIYAATVSPGQATNIKVTMKRLSVRVDIVNTNPDITVTKVVFKNRVIKANLKEQNTMPTDASWFEDKLYDQLSVKPTTDENGDMQPGKYEAEIYSYENYTVKDLADGKFPELEITYTLDADGQERTHTVKFHDSASKDEDNPDPLALKRNHLYRLSLTGTIYPEFNLEVLDWEDATQFDIEDLPLYSPAASVAELMLGFDVYKTLSTTSSVAWANAAGKCPDGWRLPTLEEALLIYIYKDAIDATPDFVKSTNTIWAGKTTDSKGYTVNMSNGLTTSNVSSGSYHVRCVRDITTDDGTDVQP